MITGTKSAINQPLKFAKMAEEQPLTFELMSDDARWPDLSDLVASCLEAVTIKKPEGIRYGELSFLLTDDATMRRLNAQFRDKDKPTNVLSFPAAEPASGGAAGPDPFVGDVALGYETCSREADEKHVSLADHAAHLIIHGVLHLFGYDHQTEKEAVAMEQLEITLLNELGISDPFQRMETH